MQTAIAPAPHTPAPGDHDYAVTGIDSRKLGMWGFLASECLFFGALISSHLLYRARSPQGVTLVPTSAIPGVAEPPGQPTTTSAPTSPSAAP